MSVEHTAHTHTSINYIGNARIREGKGGADREELVEERGR